MALGVTSDVYVKVRPFPSGTSWGLRSCLGKGRRVLCSVTGICGVAWLPVSRLTQHSEKLPGLEGSLRQKSGLLGRALPMNWTEQPLCLLPPEAVVSQASSQCEARS